jgi:hypothetical protein
MAEIRNIEIAQRLKEVAALRNEQGANPYRVQAYRHAAETVQRLDGWQRRFCKRRAWKGSPKGDFRGDRPISPVAFGDIVSPGIRFFDGVVS